MAVRCLVGLDLGTSACKAVALDGSGTVLARTAADYPMATPRPGWAEQAPADWWDGADRAMRELMRALMLALPGGCEVAAIGLSGQMHGLVALDDADSVLRPAMLWCDNRTGAQCERITGRVGGPGALLGLTRNRMLPGFTGGKLLWMAEHEPAMFAAMRRFLLPKDYLRLLMTGEHATDVSDASGTGLFDVSARGWSQPMLDAVGLSATQVPHAHESQEISGLLRADVALRWGLPAGVPVVAGGGDSVIQTTSMGVIGSGTIGITIGTAGLVGAAASHCPENQGGLLQVSCGNAPGLWHVMGVTLNGGGAFAWLREALRPVPGAIAGFDEMIRLAGTIEPGACGLLFLPSLLGERCPHVAPDARGAWVGLTQGHDARHMTRAVLEGILLNLRSILDLVRQSGAAFDHVRASGGAVASPVWLQLLADVTGRTVSTVTGAAEGGAYCAALLAGIGAGHWRDLHEAVAVIEECGTVRPRPEAARTYDRLHPIFAALHDRLHRTMQDLAAFEEGAQA